MTTKYKIILPWPNLLDKRFLKPGGGIRVNAVKNISRQ